MKKWLLLLIIINVVIFAAIIFKRNAHPLSTRGARLVNIGLTAERQEEFGLAARDLKPDEFVDATNIFLQEHRMWSQFKGMSAGINVDFQGNDGRHFSLAGDVSLCRVDLSPTGLKEFIAKYKMTISNKQNGWTVVTDGTPTNTVITCQNQQVLDAVKTIDPVSLLHMLTFPHYWFATLFQSELYPRDHENPYTFDELMKMWEPWPITNTVPHSYSFFRINNDTLYGRIDFTFKNGHINRFRKTRATPGEPVTELLSICFENPVEANGFWYPTVFWITPAPTPWPYPDMEKGWFAFLVPPDPAPGKGQLRIELSDVSVSVK